MNLHGPAISRQLKLIAYSFLLALFTSILPTAVFAQTEATISGVVADPSGAGVPGASLILTNQDTAVALITEKSDSTGNFAFQAVPAPGTYSISIQASGFSRLEQKNIVLTAGERRSVGTLTLVVGSTNDSVTVQADATPVQTESAERSGDIDAHEIGALLARGLQFNGLLRGLPGISGAVDPTTPGGAYAPYGSINGTRWSATVPTLDGVGASDPSSQGQLMATSATDSLSEVNVKMSNFQAEYGQSGGAIINLTTKSGTKQFHGDIYSYFRNEALNANAYFNNFNGIARPRYRYVIGGGSIGGPVYVPGKFNTSRNKIFFFFNDQYYQQSIPGALIQDTVPTTLERAGNFSQSFTVGGALIPVYAPGSKTPYPGNIVPPSQISAYGQDLLSVFPQTNFNNRAVSGGNYNFLFQETPVSHSNNYTYRVDFNLTDKLRMYGRNNQIDNYSEGYAVGAAPGPNWGLVKSFYKSRIETPSISLVYTITPTLINEFTFGINHWDEPGGPISQTENAKIQRSTYGLQGLGQWYPADNSNNVIPIMNFSDVPSAAAYTYDARAPIDGATTIFTIADNITKVLGKHTLKAGVDIVRTRMWKGNPGPAYSGNFAFGKDVNNPLDTGYGYSNALQGVFDTYTESSVRTGADYHEAAFEEYVQDSWKVNRRLTLEYGVRFTTRIPWNQRRNIMAGFSTGAWDPAQKSVLYNPGLNSTGQRVAVNPITGAQLPAVYIGALVPGVGNPADGMIVVGQPGVPQGLTTSPAVDLAPRFGFAYDLFGDGKTAIRGGFGITYLPTSAPSLCCSGSYQSNPPLSYTPLTYYGTLATFVNTAGTLFPSNVLGNSDSKLASSYSFSLGGQRDIGHSVVVDVAVVGNLGRNLEMSENLNQLPYGVRFFPGSQDPTTGKPLPDAFLRPYPGLGNITFREPIGTSNYYALQTQANRRFSHGFEFKANWTWSKSMDYGSTDGAAVATYGSRRLLNYGESSFDRTFVTNLSWLYELPGSQRLTNPILSTVLGHWNVSGITTFASGAPQGITFSTVAGTDLIGGGDGQRINISGNPQLGYGTRNGSQFFNTSVFSLPSLGYIGNAPRDVYRGPGQNQWDLSAFKNFSIRERTSVQLRGEFYNALNHTQWSAINSAAKFNAAGQQINTLFGQATGDRGPRVIQVALRVSF
jgi:Carboxypeptidase regulatory-like domain